MSGFLFGKTSTEKAYTDILGGSGGPLHPTTGSNSVDFDEIVDNATLDANFYINGAYGIQSSASLQVDSTASISGAITFGNLKSCDTIDTDANGLMSCGTDATGAGTPDAHGLLSDFGHNDVSNASASEGDLIYGNGTTWTPLSVGASDSFLLSNGADPIYVADPDIASMSIASLVTSTLTGTLTGDLTCTDCLNATEIEDIYFLTAGDNASASVLTVDSADITSASFGTIYAGTWNGSKIDISSYTNLTAGDHITLTDDDLDIDDDYLLNTGDEGTWVSLSDNFLSAQGIITSLSATTLNFPADSVQEADIDMDTVCGAGSFLYVNGNDFACAADDDVPEVGDFDAFSGGTNLTYDTGGNTLNVDDPFSVTTLTGTHVSASGDFTAPSGDITSLSATTITGAGLADCDNATTSKLLWSDTGVFSCGTDQTAAGIVATHMLLSDTHNDTAEASVSQGSLIVGNATPAWSELTIGASQSFLMSDGTTAFWADYVDQNTTYTGGDNLTLTGTDFDLDAYISITAASISADLDLADLNATSASFGTMEATTITEGGIAVLNNDEMDSSAELAAIIDDETGTAGKIVFSTSPELTTSFTTTGAFGINPGGALTIGDNGDTLYLNSSDWDIGTTGDMTGIGAITADGLFTGTHASLSGDLDIVGDINAASVSAANFYGTITGDLTCTDCLNATEIDDIYFLTAGDSATYASFSTGLTAAEANFTSASANTYWGAGLTDCDNATTSKLLYSDTGVFSCGTDQTAAGATSPHNLLSDIHNDTTEASVSAGSIIVGDADSWDEFTIGASGSFLLSDGTTVKWNDIAGALAVGGAITEGGIAVLSNDEMDASSELLTIIDDETGTGVIVFGTSPQFTTSFTTAGAFAINPGGALTIGDNGDTLYLNSNDWDISTAGDMTGIGAITADGLFTGTHASLSGDIDLVGDFNGSSASFTGIVQVDDILITGGNINTGNIPLVIGDATTDTIQFLTDGTGNGEYTFVADGIGDADIDWGSGAGQVDLADVPGGVAPASVFDLGGVTSFEIPNAADPTVDAAGEIAIDSTDGQLTWFGLEQTTLVATQSFSFAISSTAFDLSTIMIRRAGEAITIKSINCICKSATSVNFQLVEGDANGANGAVVDAEIVCAATNTADDGALSNAAIDAGDWLLASVSQASGECDVLSGTVEYYFTEQ